VGQLKQAIGECVQDRAIVGNAVAPCDTTANLVTNGYLPGGYVDPVLTPGHGTVAYTGGVLNFTGGPQTGSNLCTVTLTPVSGAAQVAWTFVNTSPPTCNRTKTGVGT
jgi:hypothetical protein